MLPFLSFHCTQLHSSCLIKFWMYVLSQVSSSLLEHVLATLFSLHLSIMLTNYLSLSSLVENAQSVKPSHTISLSMTTQGLPLKQHDATPLSSILLFTSLTLKQITIILFSSYYHYYTIVTIYIYITLVEVIVIC